MIRKRKAPAKIRKVTAAKAASSVNYLIVMKPHSVLIVSLLGLFSLVADPKPSEVSPPTDEVVKVSDVNELEVTTTEPDPCASPVATAMAEMEKTSRELLLATKAPLQDRQAILAMAGEYEVTFDFQETIALTSTYELKKPYSADAKELVEVIVDDGNRIILQHLLCMNDGETVIKHWKQEWRYEDPTLYEYVDVQTWKLRELSEDERRGTWTQKVAQVDDSPRYESYGRWTHHRNVSSWESDLTQRPLPRREYTKRKDYTVMMARNRHTITPNGWTHEQDNFKQISHDEGSPVLCREVGFNAYIRTDEHNFETARSYWSETKAFWSAVSDTWDQHLDAHDGFVLKKTVETRPAYKHLFYMAKKSREEGGKHLQEQLAKADAIIGRFVEASGS